MRRHLTAISLLLLLLQNLKKEHKRQEKVHESENQILPAASFIARVEFTVVIKSFGDSNTAIAVVR